MWPKSCWPCWLACIAITLLAMLLMTGICRIVATTSHRATVAMINP